MRIVRHLRRAAIETERRATAWACTRGVQTITTLVRPEVVFLGDSITEFWPAEDPGLFWPRRVNRGVRGQTAQDMRARFNRDVIALRPRAVHIMGGTNDLWFGAPGEAARSTLDNLHAMAMAARAEGIAVILAAPPPIGPAAEGLIEHLELYAPLVAGIREIAATERLVYVDYAVTLLGQDGLLRPDYTTDGVHLTRAGYRAMRHPAEQAIRAALA